MEILHGGISFVGSNRNQFEIVKENQIVILTPAIFVNLMRHPEIHQRLKINVFTLIVFDECHHTVGNHNYNLLMQEYFAIRDEGENPKEKFLPQVQTRFWGREVGSRREGAGDE